MSIYSLWDIPSSSLLLETRELGAIAESTTSFVRDNGEQALDEIILGIELDDSTSAREHTGSQILEAIAREQSTLRELERG